MTLESGHPNVVVPGHADGDADCPEDGLRNFLAKRFSLPIGVTYEPNGSELIMKNSNLALFGLYWDGFYSNETAFFKLLGETRQHTDGFDFFYLEPDNITKITESEFTRLLRV